MATETGRAETARTLGDWRRAARKTLAAVDAESAGFESDHMARHVLRLDAAAIVLQSDRILTDGERRELDGLLHRRVDGVPLQYVLGTVEFAGITLRVRPGVFIPRPETEGLVERVLGYLEGLSGPKVIDLCSGSGAVALALASALPDLKVWGTDVSQEALDLARENTRSLNLEDRVRFCRGDLIEPLIEDETRRVQVVVSNPPYISPRDRERLDPVVTEHEPHQALFAGEDGLAVIRRIGPAAAERLAPGGLLAMEIAEDAGDRVAEILTGEGSWEDIRIEKDLAGKDRYAIAVRAKTAPSG